MPWPTLEPCRSTPCGQCATAGVSSACSRPRLPEERGITVDILFAHPDGPLLATLLARVAAGELPARVHALAPLDEAATAYREVAKGGVRGRIVLVP